MIVSQTDFVVELLCKREALAAHLATVEDFIRDENRLIAILLQVETALAGNLDFDEEEGEDESI